MAMDDTMGARIRTLREAKDLTQTELADACGVTKAAVSAWETGYASNIRLHALMALIRMLGTNVEYLVYGADRSRNSPPVVSGRRRRRPPPPPA